MLISSNYSSVMLLIRGSRSPTSRSIINGIKIISSLLNGLILDTPLLSYGITYILLLIKPKSISSEKLFISSVTFGNS